MQLKNIPTFPPSDKPLILNLDMFTGSNLNYDIITTPGSSNNYVYYVN